MPLWNLAFFPHITPGHHKAVPNDEEHCYIPDMKDINLSVELTTFFYLFSLVLAQTHLMKVSAASSWGKHGGNSNMSFEPGVWAAVICVAGIVSSGLGQAAIAW